MKKLLLLLIFSLLCMGCGSSTQQAVEDSYSKLMKAAGNEKVEFIDTSENSFIGLETCSWVNKQQIIDSTIANQKSENISNLKVEIVKEEQDLVEAKISYDENGKTGSAHRIFKIKDGKAYFVPKNITKVETLSVKSPYKELDISLKSGSIYPTGDTVYWLRIKNNGNTGMAFGWAEPTRIHLETDEGNINPSSINHAGETLFGSEYGHIRLMSHDNVWISIPVKGSIKPKSIVLEQVYFLGSNGLPRDIGAPPTTLTIDIH